MVKGYAGRILHVDLTKGETWTEEPPEDFYRRYLGGNGFVAHYLLKEVPQGAEPLGPENVLVFACGTFTGIPIAGGGRNSMGAKSPLTGGYGTGEVGGFFGAELKRAGFDGIVVRGQAEKPVYLWIKEGEVEIRDASHLWGTTTLECLEAIRDELDDKRVRMAAIGPGGENMVRFACVINDLRHAAGRTGLGAVMGSKKLKAVVARARGNVELADRDRVLEHARWMGQNWKEMSWGQHELGTPGGIGNLQKIGALPTRNFQDGQFEGYESISGETLRDTITIGTEGCYACPINCKRVVEVDDEDYKVNPIYGGPEYETIGAFGSNCGIDDLRAVATCHELCNGGGLDSIACGNMVSFAMECYENGLLTDEDTGGLELNFGNAKAAVELTRQICQREGLGDLLADGPRAAAKKIGQGAEKYAIECKGQPFPMHTCRNRHGQALGYAVSPTGADHMHNFWDGSIANEPLGDPIKELGIYQSVPTTVLNGAKVHAYTVSTNWQWVQNQLCNCMFVHWSREQIVELVQGITGWQTNLWELLKAGERGVTMARVFNLREGLGREEDRLPERMSQPFMHESVNEVPVSPESLDTALDSFYGMMGWDPDTGTPTLGTLQGLDIEWVVEHLPG